MPASHVIRLRGPWEFQPLERYVSRGDGTWASATSELPAGGKAQVPCDWGATLGNDFVGCVRYVRRFNCPTNLEPAQRVWIVLAGADHQASVRLNGLHLGEFAGCDQTRRFEITTLLQPRNELVLDVSLTPTVFDDPAARLSRAGLPGGPIGEVHLEIDA